MTNDEVHDHLLWRMYRALRLLDKPEVKALWERGKPRNREEAILLQEIREGLEAREQILLDNMSLVYKVAHRYRNHAWGLGIPFEDLIQQGTVGFLEALDRFDPRGGHRLSTWAYYHIRWRIQQILQNHRPHQSLEKEHPETGTLYGDTIPTERPTPEEVAERKALKSWWDQNAPGFVELVESGESPSRAAYLLGTSLKRLRSTLADTASLWV